MSSTERDIRQNRYMTDTEAMMWAAERDPVLSSGMGSIFQLDQPLDIDRLIASMTNASKTVLRLREKVAEGVGIAPPRWTIDDNFDLKNHITTERLPSPGGQRELLDLAAEVFAEPFHTDRPLWRFVVVTGSGNRKKSAVKAAVISKLHHSISDGIGAMRLAENYLDIERDPPLRDELPDLAPTDDSTDGLEAVVADVGHVLKKQLDVARRTAAEILMWGADPVRARESAGDAAAIVKSLANQAVGATTSDAGGSPLWKTRSANRQLEVFDIPLADLKAGAARLNGTINDLFVAGTVVAASRYHQARDTDVDTFNLSFIISTRNDDAAGGNSFAPVPFSVDGRHRSPHEQFELVQSAMAIKREQVGVGVGESMELMASIATALPSAVLTKAGRARSAKIDWATSNLRGAPLPIYLAGSEVTHMYPIGPLGGTAFNLTAMSYNGNFDFGLFVDPTAVDDPRELSEHLQSAYRDLIKGGT